MSKKKGMPLGQAVKETIDFVYQYLLPFPDGVTMNARQLGKTGARVCTSLVHRGIITKTKKGTGGKEFKYKWVATMGPTKVLVGSITAELADKNKSYVDKSKNKSKKETTMDKIENEREKQEAGVVVDNPTIAQYTIQELWDEIKRRGGHIEGGQLAVTTYFN